MSSNLFSNLKEDLELAKEEIVISDQQAEISKILVITDGYDNVDWRFEMAEKIAKRHNAELVKIYLYDLKGSLFTSSEDDDVSAIDALRAHSEKIKELKNKDVEIIFDQTVKHFLVESRDIRQTSSEDEPEITSDNFDVLMDFFLDDADMEFNLINEINKYIEKYSPNLVYWKPNLLEERKWQQELGLSDIDNLILEHIPSHSLVLLEGMKKISTNQNIICFFEGGEANLEYQEILVGIESYFHDIEGNLTFVTIIDENTLNLASLIPEEELQEKDLREILTHKISQDISQLRIFDKSPKPKIIFGEVEEELDVVLRELNAELLIISPKRVGEDKFDASALGVIEIAIKEGVGVLIII